jgi:hypothetical protein
MDIIQWMHVVLAVTKRDPIHFLILSQKLVQPFVKKDITQTHIYVTNVMKFVNRV